MSEEKKAAVARYHRKTLLDAADRLLMQYGYDGMNMNMLAKEAGYSKATVYVYLSSKDEIVRLLCIERLKLLRKEFSVILKNEVSVADKLDEVRAVLDEFAVEDKTYFDFICGCTFADELSDASDSEKELFIDKRYICRSVRSFVARRSQTALVCLLRQNQDRKNVCLQRRSA